METFPRTYSICKTCEFDCNAYNSTANTGGARKHVPGGLNNGGAMTLMTLILQENMPKKFTRFASSDPQHYARLIRRKKKSLLVVKYPVYV